MSGFLCNLRLFGLGVCRGCRLGRLFTTLVLLVLTCRSLLGKCASCSLVICVLFGSRSVLAGCRKGIRGRRGLGSRPGGASKRRASACKTDLSMSFSFGRLSHLFTGCAEFV